MDITLILKIALIGMLTAIANMLLKKANKEDIATLVSIAGLIMCIIMVIDMVVQLFDTIKSLFDFAI